MAASSPLLDAAPRRTADPPTFWASGRRRLECAVRWRRARRRTGWRDFAALGGILVGLALAGVGWWRSGLLFNHTGSIPLGLYRVARVGGEARRAGAVPVPPRGAVVAWCLPRALSDAARRQGYLVRGHCPGGAEPILKYMAALPGDTVRVTAEGLTVNGRLLANSRPAARDSHGRALVAIPPGTYPVPPGRAWLWSPHTTLSFDSRYYGPLELRGLVGVARPVWTSHPALPAGAHAGLLPAELACETDALLVDER